ncbi:MAG: hypothetical protein JOZ46_08780 [Candidatus Dormibacteraeota bacterium]|nr:hypothetical protein [Candidatus Dormibacteraeota bacterium]MBV9525891.1 hypothetical protein [Candidatus Dormibacteraeota bacterium]
MSTSTRRSPAISIICVLLAIVCAIGAVYYWTQSTSFLAGTPGIHHKHAAIFAALTVVFLLGAIAFRPRRLPRY